MTDEQRLQYVIGRLYGLCGTVRYEMDPKLRLELKELAAILNKQETN